MPLECLDNEDDDNYAEVCVCMNYRYNEIRT